MIKPKYPKRADISQIARSIVEHATGEPLTPAMKLAKKASHKKNAVRNQNRNYSQNTNKHTS